MENRILAIPCSSSPRARVPLWAFPRSANRDALRSGLRYAGKYDKKILVEEFINGKEIEVAVMGNDNPMASICGEIDSGAEFYDYDAKYLTDDLQGLYPRPHPCRGGGSGAGDGSRRSTTPLAVRA